MKAAALPACFLRGLRGTDRGQRSVNVGIFNPCHALPRQHELNVVFKILADAVCREWHALQGVVCYGEAIAKNSRGEAQAGASRGLAAH